MFSFLFIFIFRGVAAPLEHHPGRVSAHLSEPRPAVVHPSGEGVYVFELLHVEHPLVDYLVQPCKFLHAYQICFTINYIINK